MARSTNSKCLECSKYSIEWARMVHGPDGDGCWVEEKNRCEKLRWQYQNRAEQTARRRLEYRLRQQAKETVDSVSFSVLQRPTPIRIIFSEEPNSFKKNVTLVHAIEFQLWIGTDCHAKREPIACWGMRGDEVAKLMEQILNEFTIQYSATLNQGKPFKKFVTIHKHIRECKINNPWSCQHE